MTDSWDAGSCPAVPLPALAAPGLLSSCCFAWQCSTCSFQKADIIYHISSLQSLPSARETAALHHEVPGAAVPWQGRCHRSAMAGMLSLLPSCTQPAQQHGRGPCPPSCPSLLCCCPPGAAFSGSMPLYIWVKRGEFVLRLAGRGACVCPTAPWPPACCCLGRGGVG